MVWDPILLPNKPWRQPQIPTLGATCRHFREGRRMSREVASRTCGVATSWLYRIEMQHQMPSIEVLDQIIKGYRLDSAQAKHLHELRVPGESLEPSRDLRDRVTANAAQMAHLRDLESLGVLAAYVDPMASILACNNLFRAAFPGVEEMGSYPVWVFSDQAKEVLVNWPREADHAVESTKRALGRYRDARQSQDLLRHLRSTKEYRSRWAASIKIAYGRDTNALLYLRDSVSKVVTAYSMSHSHESRSVLLYVGFPKDDATHRLS
ncbi:helix-turn-helix domain-containing protein [Nocardia brasiliensis]|uniref:MmyB family transcriptional regulator n=1 Tax=Nocardia brasiliensis TaxID=37326 RepID=UPI002457C454|nr:helix-turn-helix domain-containing protein [Nocardia brasiliensis]